MKPSKNWELKQATKIKLVRRSFAFPYTKTFTTTKPKKNKKKRRRNENYWNTNIFFFATQLMNAKIKCENQEKTICRVQVNLFVFH